MSLVGRYIGGLFAKPMPARKTVVFVVGTARSGTTALVHLLNAHSRICLGMERYKYVSRFKGNEFGKERFFAISPEDTNVVPKPKGQWGRFYAELEARYDRSLVVGDKRGIRPGIFQHVASVYPDVRFLHIVRSIDSVAASWNARAAARKDHWARDADYRAAVPRWNAANREALKAIDLGLPVAVIDYEKFYGGRSDVDAVLRFLGVAPEEGFFEKYRASCRFFEERVRDKVPALLPGQDAHIAGHADREGFQRLRTLAL